MRLVEFEWTGAEGASVAVTTSPTGEFTSFFLAPWEKEIHGKRFPISVIPAKFLFAGSQSLYLAPSGRRKFTASAFQYLSSRRTPGPRLSTSTEAESLGPVFRRDDRKKVQAALSTPPSILRNILGPELRLFPDEALHQGRAIRIIRNDHLNAARAQEFLVPAECLVLPDNDPRACPAKVRSGLATRTCSNMGFQTA